PDLLGWRAQDIASELRKLPNFSNNEVNKAIDNYIKIGGNEPREGPTLRLKNLIKRKGYDGIVYLNRHEGENVQKFRNDVPNGNALLHPSVMTDKEFQKYVPSAKDSYIAFDPEQIRSEYA